MQIQDLPTFKYKSYDDFKASCLKGFGNLLLNLFNPGTIDDENKRCWLTIKNSPELQEVIKAGNQVYTGYVIAYSDTTNPVGIMRDETGRISDKEFELMVSTFKLIP